ncbi:MAG: serine hydrolase [Sphingobacteriales bacterium]|nr:MAG: serine hydrolase [Sphingobacteriales bacterium]
MPYLRLISLFCLLFNGLAGTAQPLPHNSPQYWADSVYKRLTPRERIGQLFMIAAYSGGKNMNDEKVTSLVASGSVGGLIFMQGGPVRQAVLTNKYQKLAPVPLLLAMDAEWGLGMRLDSVQNYPRQMLLGATRDTALMYRIGTAIALQCKRLGVHVNFAPDVDVNNNPDNPVINTRSFGENKYEVSRMGIAYMRGLQNNSIMACAKHFPGHGNTSVDSHKDLPVISESRASLDSTEFYPFRKLIEAGVQSVMVAHLEVPALEKSPKIPTTLSYSTITQVLKKDLGFSGLVFTDALNMEGVAKYFAPGEVDLKAFLAGNDVLLFSQDVPAAIAAIESAMKDGRISAARLETSVKKILAAKHRAGLTSFTPISTVGITEDLNRSTAQLRTEASAAAVTVIGSSNRSLTTIRQKGSRVGYIGVNAAGPNALFQALKDSLGAGLEARWLPKGSTEATANELFRNLDRYDAVIVGVHGIGWTPANNYGLDAGAMAFLQKVQSESKVLLVIGGNAYAIKDLCRIGSGLVTYEDDSFSQRAVASVILGRTGTKGRLPVTPCPEVKTGAILPPKTGVIPMPKSGSPAELVPGSYDEAGVTDPPKLTVLSQLIGSAIGRGAFPGCRVLAARNGKVFYDNAFGKTTYGPAAPPVTRNTIYDVASLTKVLATTLAVMKLTEDGKLSIDGTIGQYLPRARGTDKAAIRVRDLLLHRAGLVAYIPFWKETLDSTKSKDARAYRNSRQKGFDLQVSEGLFIRNDYRDTLWDAIYASKLGPAGKYVYSDNDYYFLWAIVEQISGKPMPQYLQETFYGPLGLQRTGYNPLARFTKTEIAPTENDQLWRGNLVWGTVHDQGAAMLGGVAGHAGIFSTADEVAVIFQMLLNGGTYKGKRYFKAETVERFTGYGSTASRRGLGFDKPERGTNAVTTSDRCSAQTFGHTGFTGTCAWADPETGIVFVFLSNRVHPSAENGLITKLGVRTEAQDRIYEAFGLPVVKR